MKCITCGKELPTTALFCNKCGTKVDDKSTPSNTLATPKNNQNNFKSQALGWIGTIGGIALGKLLGLAFFIIIIFPILGYYFAKWYTKNNRQRNWITNLIIWSNLITWIFPIAGYFTSIASLTIYENTDKTNKKAQILGWICLILSIINSLIGISNGLNNT